MVSTLSATSVASCAASIERKTVTEKVENTAQFGEIRKDVARLLTERNARRLSKAGKGKK